MLTNPVLSHPHTPEQPISKPFNRSLHPTYFSPNLVEQNHFWTSVLIYRLQTSVGILKPSHFLVFPLFLFLAIVSWLQTEITVLWSPGTEAVFIVADTAYQTSCVVNFIQGSLWSPLKVNSHEQITVLKIHHSLYSLQNQGISLLGTDKVWWGVHVSPALPREGWGEATTRTPHLQHWLQL